MTEWFCITAIGNQNLILGLPWLEKHNPIVNWKEKTLEFHDSKTDRIRASIQSFGSGFHPSDILRPLVGIR